jgi:hypothetical protein
MLAGTFENASAPFGDEGRGRSGLFVVSLDGNRLEIFGFEDLPAVETFDVVHTIAAGDDYCFFMLAGGLHRDVLVYEWKIRIILMIRKAVSRVCGTYLST